MAPEPEALAQVSRLLGDDTLRSALPAEISAAVDKGFDRLVEGLLGEAMASDDVFDRDSALEFIDDRLSFLQSLIDAPQRSRLREALRGRIEAW